MRCMKMACLMILVMLLSGCTADKYFIKARQDYIDGHPERPQEIKECIKEGAIMRGMTKEEVILSWGDTIHKNKTVTSLGESEQWEYDKWLKEGSDISNLQYLYFEDGVLQSWQSSVR